MTDFESEGGLGVELSSVQWEPLYFDEEEKACEYMVKNPSTVYPDVFPQKDGRFLVFIKE